MKYTNYICVQLDYDIEEWTLNIHTLCIMYIQRLYISVHENNADFGELISPWFAAY